MSEKDRFAPGKSSVKQKAKFYDKFVGAKKDADKKPRTKAGSTKQECPLKKKKEKPKIVSVQFLDGDDDTELASNGKLFVNLPRETKWVDGTHVLNVDRLSQKPRVKVRFNQNGSHKFKVKYETGNNNVAYSNAEKGRNGNFKYETSEKQYTTDADGTKIVPGDLFVAAAGKDDYTLVAEDEYKTPPVKSNSIQTHRLIYYQELKMDSANVIAPANLATFETEFAKHNITLAGLSRVNMEHIENISNSDHDTTAFKNAARKAFFCSTGPTKQPYVVAVAYTDHLAVMDGSVDRSWNQTVGPGQPDKTVSLVQDGRRKYLWKGLVSGEGWFVSAQFEDNATGQVVPIDKSNCTAVPSNNAYPDKCNKVRVKVDNIKLKLGIGTKIGRFLGLSSYNPVRAGKIRLTINWVNRFRGGLSYGGGNLICICTRAFWQSDDTASMNQTLIHEMGHKVGMVPDGTGKKPDKTETFYDSSKGHVGTHCYKGLPDGEAKYDKPGDGASSQCVMYGATNGKSAFCDKCTPAVRKQDISEGWGLF
ncbi:MAG: hypothetical protein JW741_16305 [Sedimentisphaerales bacterium]|nr:hypothetical protein [Sedimentisphaerales bacterium]